MESRPDLTAAKALFGTSYIGARELEAIAPAMGLSVPVVEPELRFSEAQLDAASATHLLLLGTSLTTSNQPLTLNWMRDFWGVDPERRQPCFYNQDWYVGESFAQSPNLSPRWYLIRREVLESTRGLSPETLAPEFACGEQFPTALLASYAFFAFYLHTRGQVLWKHSFIWCSDTDHNGDRIYVGRYLDPDGVNKVGFNIHRHLQIRRSYGVASEIRPTS